MDRVQIDPATLRGKPGYHQVGQDRRGKWWFVGPDSRPWFHRGVTSVHLQNPAAEVPPEQRQAGAPLQLSSPDHVIQWLRGLGINALGAWTQDPLFDRGMPFAVLIHTRRVSPELAIVEKGLKMIDVFDPRFPVAYEAACATRAGALARSRDLIGYFTDNEPGWAQAYREHVWGGTANVAPGVPSPTLLQICLAQPPERAAHGAAWRFVLERAGGSMGALAARWGIECCDVSAFRRLHDAGQVLDSAAYVEDHEAFSYRYATEYFRIVGETLRRHDPNHLVLGCRYGGNPGPVILRAQRQAFEAGWCDVLSMNSYRVDLAQRLETYARATGMPILNGEFAWASDYFRWPRADGQDEALSVNDRTRQRGTSALEAGIAHPSLVGYSWFKFRHNFTDPADPHYGLVNQADVANQFNCGMLTEINARAEALATGTEVPRSIDPGTIRNPGLESI
jgi:hypothetical protein